MDSFVKDPDSIEYFSVLWGDWLDENETIATSSFTVPAGLTKTQDTKDDSSTTVWLSGGTAGQDYLVTNRVTTSGGRTEDHSFVVRCREK